MEGQAKHQIKREIGRGCGRANVHAPKTKICSSGGELKRKNKTRNGRGWGFLGRSNLDGVPMRLKHNFDVE